ncbi:MAG TPA: hypothetical protein PK263_04515 [bacterium]|nr:hypothetical protein [bacterium]
MTKNKKIKRFPLQITRGSIVGFIVGLALTIGGFFAYSYAACGNNPPTNEECTWSVDESDCSAHCADFSMCCNGTCNRSTPCLIGCAKEKNKCHDKCHECCEAKFEECDKAYDENGSEWYRCSENLSKCRKACGYKWQ